MAWEQDSSLWVLPETPKLCTLMARLHGLDQGRNQVRVGPGFSVASSRVGNSVDLPISLSVFVCVFINHSTNNNSCATVPTVQHYNNDIFNDAGMLFNLCVATTPPIRNGHGYGLFPGNRSSLSPVPDVFSRTNPK